MLIPSSDRLEGKTDSLYALCVLAAKRARQLKDPMVRKLAEADSSHPLTVALEEIADGAIKARYVEKPVPEPHEFQEAVEGILGRTGAGEGEEAAAPSVHDLLRVDGEEEELEAEADETEEPEEVKDLFEAISSGEVEPIVEEEEEEEEEAAASSEEAEEAEEEEEEAQEDGAEPEHEPGWVADESGEEEAE